MKNIGRSYRITFLGEIVQLFGFVLSTEFVSIVHDNVCRVLYRSSVWGPFFMFRFSLGVHCVVHSLGSLNGSMVGSLVFSVVLSFMSPVISILEFLNSDADLHCIASPPTIPLKLE